MAYGDQDCRMDLRPVGYLRHQVKLKIETNLDRCHEAKANPFNQVFDMPDIQFATATEMILLTKPCNNPGI